MLEICHLALPLHSLQLSLLILNNVPYPFSAGGMPAVHWCNLKHKTKRNTLIFTRNENIMADVILTKLLEDSLLLLKTKDGQFSFKNQKSQRAHSQSTKHLLCTAFVVALSKHKQMARFAVILSFALPQPNPDFLN